MKKTAGNIFLCLMIAVLSGCLLFNAGAEDADPAEPLIVDLDLSGMSGTVVYAQVYNLLSDPAPWLGKIIRMAGYYSFYDDQDRLVTPSAATRILIRRMCADGTSAWPRTEKQTKTCYLKYRSGPPAITNTKK